MAQGFCCIDLRYRILKFFSYWLNLEVEMKGLVKVISIGILFTVLLTACGGSSKSGADTEDVVLEELSREIQDVIAEGEVLPELPLLSQLEASPEVVGPGDVIDLHGAPMLSGDVTITHGSFSETVVFSAGSGSYAVPSDAPDGVYSISLENEAGAVAIGSFRVSSGPGIWLDVVGSYLGPDEVATIRVTANQVSLDMVAVFRSGDLAQAVSSEDENYDDFEEFDPFRFDGPSAYLLPDSNGVLQLGSLPGMPLYELVDQTFYLPGRFANQLQVSALDPEIAGYLAEGNYEALSAFDDETLPGGLEQISNIVSIQHCDLEGEVSGNLGGAGTVRAVSLDGEMLTRIFSTENGIFSIQLPAGKAFIEGWFEDEGGMTYYPPQAVEVPCGESVQVDFTAASSPRLASLSPGIALNSPPAQDGGGEDVCERIYVGKPGKVPEGFEGAEMLTSIYAAQLDARLSRASVATFYDNRTLLELAAKDQWDDGDGDEYIHTIRENLSADFVVFYQVYRVSGDQFASVTAFDTSKGWQAPFARTIIWGDALSELSRLPDSFINKIQKAGVCAKIEPVESVIEPNQTVELTLEITDLAGEAHEEVDLSLAGKAPVCGDLEWTEKKIEGTSISNQYTANDELSCHDTLVFVGETEGPQGVINSDPEQGTTKIIKPILFHFNMTTELYGENDGRIDFAWDVEFYADEENLVKTVIQPGNSTAEAGRFTSQNIHCEVRENGVLTFRSENLNPNATWDIELGGKMEIFENGFVEVRLTPVGTSWDFDMQPFPEECTVLIENIFIYFVKLISLQPANLVKGSTFEFGALVDQPFTINFPLEGTNGYQVTISRAATQRNQQ